MVGLWVSPTRYLDLGEHKINDLTREIASRSLAWDYSGIMGLLPDPDPVLRKRGDGAEILEGLTADGKVITSIQTRKLGTLKREYKFSPGSVDGQTDARSEQLCRDLTEDLEDVSMYDLLSGLLDAPYYGMTPAELFWESRGGSIHLAKIQVLPDRWFGFDDANSPRFRSLASPFDGEEIPAGKMVFARHFPTYDNPFGLRLLSRCLWPVAFKAGGTRFWVTFCEKYGMPFLVGKYRQGASADEQQTLLSALAKMVQDAVAVIPDGNVIEFLDKGSSGSGGSTDTYSQLRKAMDAEISQVLMGQTLTAEIGDAGSYAASKTHEDVLDDYRLADQQMVQGVMNEIAKLYRDINAADVPAPVFEWFEDEDPQAAFAERDKALIEGGLKIKKAYYVRRYNFREDEIEVAAEPEGQPPEPEKQEFAEAGRTQFTASQQALEDLADTALAGVDLSGNEDAILQAVLQADSYDQAMENLLALYPALDMSGLQTMMERVLVAAEMSGRMGDGDGQA